jgi:hypothetical protein
MILKQPDNLSKLLAAIAIFGINCTPAYAATLATSNPSPQPAKQLLAQQATIKKSCRGNPPVVAPSNRRAVSR